MKFKAYHKIKQFKDVVRSISMASNFKGLDENEQPIYESSIQPVLDFVGTIKLHGTNAQIVYSQNEGLRVGKRNSLLSKEQLTGHMGFQEFVIFKNKEYFEELLKKYYKDFEMEGDQQIIFYGEWAGGNIQKGVAITQLPKSFYIFDAKMYDPITDISLWIDILNIKVDNSKLVFNIYDFPYYNIRIDFNNLQNSLEELTKITEEVEKQCPVAKQLGVEGIGEGVVWHTFWKGDKYIFKVKGQKHSTTKAKKLVFISPEKVKSINEFVNLTTTYNRVMQGIKEVNATEKSHMRELIAWVKKDILDEDSDTLVVNNLEFKDVVGQINNRVREIYFRYLKSNF